MGFFRKVKDYILGEVLNQYHGRWKLFPPPPTSKPLPIARSRSFGLDPSRYAAQDLLDDGTDSGHQRVKSEHQTGQPQTGGPRKVVPRQAAASAAQAQKQTAARRAPPPPPPLLQDAHPVTGGGIQASRRVFLRPLPLRHVRTSIGHQRASRPPSPDSKISLACRLHLV